MATYRELLENGKKYLKEKQIEDGNLDAWLLMEHVCGISRTWYFVHEQEEAPKEQETEYRRLFRLRGEKIPLQQLTHEAYFYGMKFYVNEHVLIPRQDTEVLVEEVLKEAKAGKGLRILDMCTGSGCILLSLLANLEEAEGTGADLSREALKVAERNGKMLGLSAQWINSDLFQQISGKYDILVSNPPYIQTAVIEGLMEEVKCHEPRMALDGKEDGLYFYRKITEQAGAFLNLGGLLAFEIGYDQGEAVARLLKEQGYEEIQIIKDLAGLDRVVTGKKNQEENHV